MISTLILSMALIGQTEAPPAHLAEAFAIINQGRVAIHKPPFKWSNRLTHSAQELAEWSWLHYLKGDVTVMSDPHHDFQGRLERAGVVAKGQDWWGIASESGAGGDTSTTGEDGKRYPIDRDGWALPYRSPGNHAKGNIWAYVTSPWAKANPTEGHVADFSGKWTHVGIGWKAGAFVLDYGLQ
jgi:hypothetical protein